jgi:hypothetical protein
VDQVVELGHMKILVMVQEILLLLLLLKGIVVLQVLIIYQAKQPVGGAVLVRRVKVLMVEQVENGPVVPEHITPAGAVVVLMLCLVLHNGDMVV